MPEGLKEKQRATSASLAVNGREERRGETSSTCAARRSNRHYRRHGHPDERADEEQRAAGAPHGGKIGENTAAVVTRTGGPARSNELLPQSASCCGRSPLRLPTPTAGLFLPPQASSSSPPCSCRRPPPHLPPPTAAVVTGREGRQGDDDMICRGFLGGVLSRPRRVRHV